jgi:hypothetical protein
MSRARFHPNRLVIEIADILCRHGQDYARAHAAHLGRVERRVMSAITACRTAALGGHVEACDTCGVSRIAYNSCLMGKSRNGELAGCVASDPSRLKRFSSDLRPSLSP